MSAKLPQSWLDIIGGEFELPYMAELRSFLKEQYEQYDCYPAKADIFRAFWLTPFPKVRVVILGQDPYHGAGQAHGLAFSVPDGVKAPPSLENILHELCSDLGKAYWTDHASLEPWAKQGVFLLNTILTVKAHTPLSHAGRGWERFTDKVIRELSLKRENLVFVLWGKKAQAKVDLIAPGHLILKAPHPSPYSANSGFFGSRPFSKINKYLVEELAQEPIDWTLR